MLVLSTWVSVALGLGAAALLAVAAVLQQSAAAAVPVTAGSAGAGAFVRGLLSRPRWLVGQVVGATGIALFATALHLGRVVVVQPLLATQLVLSLVVVALLQRRATGRWGVGRAQWASAAVVVAGLVLFLLTAHPAAGRAGDQLLLGAAVAGALALDAAVVATQRMAAPRHRPLALAVAAGAGFGVDALLIKEVTAQVAAGHLLTWPALALLVLASTSVVLSQRAFQGGSVTGVLPAITTVESVVALLLAGPVFGEHLAAGGLDRLCQAAGLLALVVGVGALARAEARAESRSEPGSGARPRPAGPAVGSALPRELAGAGSAR